MTTYRPLGPLLGGLASCALLACHATHAVAPAAALGAPWRPLSRGEIRRTLVDKRPATDLPGWETRLYLIEYGPAAVAPVHAHPVVGVGLVLSGSFESAFGDEPLVRVQAGRSFVDPARTVHRVFRNTSETEELRFVVAYTIRPDEPIFYSARVDPGGVAPSHEEATGSGLAQDVSGSERR